jgi:hypothetical protein
MVTNPFTYGNPISEPRHFFGRMYEVDQIFSRLRNAEFESSSVVGERRVGKTSLLKYIMHPGVCRAQGMDPSKYLFIYLDLEMLEQSTTPTQVWHRLLHRMAQVCCDHEIKQLLEELRQAPSLDNFVLGDVFDRVDEDDQYVVFLLDEFENVTENPNFEPAFFFGLRSLAIHHNMALITSSRRELIDLCHSQAVRSSPFFNIFANLNIGLFAEAEAHQLIAQLLSEASLTFTPEEMSTLLRFAGYHPYFLQAACHFLCKAYTKGLGESERLKFLKNGYCKEATAHFSAYWNHSCDQEKIVLTVLALLKRQERQKIGKYSFNPKQLQALYDCSGQTIGHLEKRALVTTTEHSYALFNETFGEWIYNEVTDTLHDQQTYGEWLKSNKGSMERLTVDLRSTLGDILPRISSKYRDLFISAVCDPRNFILIMHLMRSVLGFG